MLSAIACIDDNGLLGINNKLVYRFPEDMKIFKQLTIGNTLYCGPNTFAEMGNLKERRIEVLYEEHDLPKDADGFLVGGAKIFERHLTACDIVYLSRVKPEYIIYPAPYDHRVYFPMSQLKEHFYLAHSIDHPKFVFQQYIKQT